MPPRAKKLRSSQYLWVLIRPERDGQAGRQTVSTWEAPQNQIENDAHQEAKESTLRDCHRKSKETNWKTVGRCWKLGTGDEARADAARKAEVNFRSAAEMVSWTRSVLNRKQIYFLSQMHIDMRQAKEKKKSVSLCIWSLWMPSGNVAEMHANTSFSLFQIVVLNYRITKKRNKEKKIDIKTSDELLRKIKLNWTRFAITYT